MIIESQIGAKILIVSKAKNEKYVFSHSSII